MDLEGRRCNLLVVFFFFNDTATTEIYTLSLHDALPISLLRVLQRRCCGQLDGRWNFKRIANGRSEEHTSELQSQSNLVCRLLLEKKNNQQAHFILILTLVNDEAHVCRPQNFPLLALALY